MRGTNRVIIVIAAVGLLAACGGAVESGGGELPPPPWPDVSYSVKDLQLLRVSGETFRQRVNQDAIAEMERGVICQEPVAEYVLDRFSGSPDVDIDSGNIMPSVSPTAPSGESGDTSAPETADAPEPTVTFTFTDTNNQEAGVEEADLVKVRDGKAYILRQNVLRIVRVWPFAQFGEIATLAVDGSPIGLMASADRLAVLTRTARPMQEADFATTSTRYIKLTLVDISNPSVPTILRSSYYQGAFVATRRIDDRIVLVMHGALREPEETRSYRWNAYAEDCESRVEAERANRRRAIETRTLQEWMPEKLRLSGDPEALGVDMNSFAVNEVAGASLLEIITIDITDRDLRDQMEAVYGRAMTVYVSPQAVYASQTVRMVEEFATEGTAVHGFRIDAGAPEYVGTGVVKGTLLNQFAMSEYEGVLRVATTIGRRGVSGSGVYTLDAETDLSPLGSVEGLAKGEWIYAVRFIGPTGYVVTFKKVDPLFVIDLADPSHPAVVGELKIPGFSTYLHPMGPGRLIGFGKDADDQGSFAWFQGLKLSMFDVRNPADPTEVHNEIIGGRNSTSPALDDHHAFTYDASRGLLAFPLVLYDGESGSGSTSGKFTYAGLHLYRVTESNGFELVGAVQDTNSGTSSYYWQSSIKRSVIMGDADTTGLLLIRENNIELVDVDAGLSSLGKVEG